MLICGIYLYRIVQGNEIVTTGLLRIEETLSNINQFSTYTYKSNSMQIKNSKPLLYIYLYNEFRLKKIISLEITYEYASATVDGIFITNPTSNLSATLKKSFFKDKLVCRLAANDILNTYVIAGISNIPAMISISLPGRIFIVLFFH